jgi:hypothetical protein
MEMLDTPDLGECEIDNREAELSSRSESMSLINLSHVEDSSIKESQSHMRGPHRYHVNARITRASYRLAFFFSQTCGAGEATSTLQELIAPTSVEFFSQEHNRLGSKHSLEETIHEITGITIEALRGEPLPNFEIEQRFSWAEHRETKR